MQCRVVHLVRNARWLVAAAADELRKIYTTPGEAALEGSAAFTHGPGTYR